MVLCFSLSALCGEMTREKRVLPSWSWLPVSPVPHPAPNLFLQLWCGGGGGGDAAWGKLDAPSPGEAALISHLPSVTQQISV